MTKSISLRKQVLILTAARTVLNTGYRMMYPFLNTFARGLGVEFTTLSLVFTARSLTGFFGPFLAPIADRRGRKISMLLGLGLMTFSALLITFLPTFFFFFAAMILSALGSLMFIPALQAYLSDQTPFHQRGRVLGITELSWSLAFIFGVPAVGGIITFFSRFNSTADLAWRTPFPFLAAFGLVSITLIYRYIPNTQSLDLNKKNGWNTIRQVLSSHPVWAGLVFGVAISCANEVVNLVFGVWLEDQFNLQLAALGAASAVIGISELSGEGLSTLFVDRIGKPFSIRIGLLFSVIASGWLYFFSSSPLGALSGLFIFYIGFEFTIVSSLPLISGLYSQSRATLMALAMASFSIGRAAGALLSPWLYQWNFLSNLIAAILFNGVAFLCLLWMKPNEE
ncbi:MAG: hypothetical protein CL609_00595 [Anaerolineaceae bacterium]|nr:hypothetical protein [Anaerolineaceae bacterium]